VRFILINNIEIQVKHLLFEVVYTIVYDDSFTFAITSRNNFRSAYDLLSASRGAVVFYFPFYRDCTSPLNLLTSSSGGQLKDCC
jgi:hypothetical protein